MSFPAINPESVAAKMAALHNLESPKFRAAVEKQPRLLELAWTVQWFSHQPGGIEKFCQDFLEFFPANIGTPAMCRIGKTDEPYTDAERQDVIGGFPCFFDTSMFGGDPFAKQPGNDILEAFALEMYGRCDVFNQRNPDPAFVNRQNHSYFYDYCRRYALETLPALLQKFCVRDDFCLPDAWFFQDLTGTLIDYLDAHAARTGDALADTEIARQTNSALNFASRKKVAVLISGPARFGKTESCKNYCAAHPGKARLVSTPSSNSERDLFNAIAEAVGIEVTPQTRASETKARLEYVLSPDIS